MMRSLVFGLFAGAFAAVAVLDAGLPFWISLLAYSLTGAVTVLASSALAVVQMRLRRVRPARA